MTKRLRRTRIKICGLTREEDVDAAVEAGADAIGFVLYAPSARSVNMDRAVELAKRLPPFVTPVIVFVNAKVPEVLLLQEYLPTALFQFHGDEDSRWCESWEHPFIKSIHMHSDTNLVELAGQYHNAKALLLDTPTEKHGGSGEVFDWSLIPQSVAPRVVLSGGLNAANVKQAILSVKPWAVDVCSGVEASAGIKDIKAIHRFIQSVRVADACLFQT